jgi:hypothetical protein
MEESPDLVVAEKLKFFVSLFSFRDGVFGKGLAPDNHQKFQIRQKVNDIPNI